MWRVAASVSRSTPEPQVYSSLVYGLSVYLGSGLDLLAEPAARDKSQGQDNQ